MKHAVLSYSGGMDSTSLLLRLLREGYFVHCYSFKYGQKHHRELECAVNNISYLRVQLSHSSFIEHSIVDLSSTMSQFLSALTTEEIDVPKGYYMDESMKQTVVPNRNAIFSAIIYGHALSISKRFDSDVSICLGTHSGDHSIYPDCRPEFHDALDYAFKIGNWGSEKITNYLPYLLSNKTTILQDAILSCNLLGIDFNIVFSNTNTCYSPNELGESCGECGSCRERLEAFSNSNLKDPIIYSR